MQITLANVRVVRKRLSSGEIKLYYYHAKTGRPIKGKPGGLDFALSHAEAAKIKSDSVEKFPHLLIAYQGSPQFRSLAKTTKSNYRTRIERIRHAFGDVALKTLSNRQFRADVLAWRDEIAVKTPEAARALFKLMSSILAFGEERAIIELNPLKGIKLNSPKNRSEMVWTLGQIKTVISHSPMELEWAIKLALLTGQRRGDLIKWPWQNMRGDLLSLQQSKTMARVDIPVGPSLARLLNGIPRRADTILTNRHGRPWADGSGLSKMWREAVAKAGFGHLDLTFHDLRGTAVTCLADAGCTHIQIAAITGHSLEHVGKILKIYLKRTTEQARQAVAMLETSWIGDLQTA